MTTKHDQGKLLYHLLPAKAVKVVVEVLTKGAAKYEEENWRTVKDWRKRYTSAAMRHLEAYRMGEHRDQETGLPHLAHLVCCTLFLLELEEHPTQVAFRSAADEFWSREEFKAKLRGMPTDWEAVAQAHRQVEPPPCVWGEATAKSQAHRQEVKEAPQGGPYRTPGNVGQEQRWKSQNDPRTLCTCSPIPGTVGRWGDGGLHSVDPRCPRHGDVQGTFHTASGETLDTLGHVMVGLPRPKDPQGKPFSDKEYRKAIVDLLTMRHG